MDELRADAARGDRVDMMEASLDGVPDLISRFAPS
jgi:hypothetical protein